MARPRKDGVDYWPMDVDMFEDKKLKLIKGEFGIKGMFIAMYIINEIYRTGGYYKVWDSDDYVLMADNIGDGCSHSLVREVLNGCLERSLFDKRVFEMFGVVTSRGIQRRFVKIASANRPNVPIIEEYWLLNVNDESDVTAGALKKLAFKSVKSMGNPVFRVENPKKRQENSTKKSKEKKSKANESKAEQSTENSRTEASASDTAVKESEAAAVAAADREEENDACCNSSAEDFAGMYAEYKKQAEQKYAEASLNAAQKENAVNDTVECSIYKAFAKIKPVSASDVRQLDILEEQYGREMVIAAIDDAARKGGKSVAYVDRILTDSAYKASSAQTQSAKTAANCRSGRYAPTYDDINEVEQYLHDEWFSDWEDYEDNTQ